MEKLNPNLYTYDELADYAETFGFDVREIFDFKDIEDVKATKNYLILSDLEDIYGEQERKNVECIDIIIRKDNKQGPGYHYFTTGHYSYTLDIRPMYKYNQKYYRVVGIEAGTFYNSSYLTIVAIPDTVTDIGNRAFFECEFLESVYIGAGLKYINSEMFKGKSLQRIKISKKNPYYCDVDGVVYTKDMKTLVKYPENKQDKEFVVPDTVENIADKAFHCVKNLEKVTLGKNTKKLGEASFAECKNLKVLNLVNVEYFAEGSIWGCENLIELIFPSTTKYIGKNTFKYCKNTVFKYDGTQTTWSLIFKNDDWNQENKEIIFLK